MNVVVLHQAGSLAAFGHTVHILTRRSDPEQPDAVRLDSGVVVRFLSAGPTVPVSKGEHEAFIEAFRDSLACDSEVYDIIHSHHWFSGIAALPVAQQRGVPHICSYHSIAAAIDTPLSEGERPESSGRLAGEAKLATESDVIVAVSLAEAHTIKTRLGGPADRIFVVLPGVDSLTFIPSVGPGPHRSYVVVAARLQPLKGIDLAIAAVAAVPEDHRPDLVIAGGVSSEEGGYADLLREVSSSHGVAERVRFVGPQEREDLAELFRQSLAVLVPSHSETFGLVALEGSASGVPVVVSSAPGLREAVISGQTGVVVDSRDPAEWAAIIGRIISDKAYAKRLGMAGRQRAEQLTWAHSAQRLAKIYENSQRFTYRADPVDLKLLMAVTVMQGMDEQLLPASFHALESGLGFSPQELACLLAAQGIAQSLSAPMWAALVDQGISPQKCLSSAVLSWGILTMAVSWTDRFATMVFLRFVNGLSLGMLLPVLQHCIVSLGSSSLGKKFGCFGCARDGGGMLGTVTMTWFGVGNGWRSIVRSTGCASIVLASLAFFQCSGSQSLLPREKMKFGEMCANISRIASMRTFQWLLLQGIFGMMGWYALHFLNLWFRYVGMSAFETSLLLSVFSVVGAFGNIVGGWVGDALAAKWPIHGRTIAAEITIGAKIPLVVIMLRVVPMSTSSLPIYFILVAAMKLVGSWIYASTNGPLLSQLAGGGNRAMIMALLVAVQDSFGYACGPGLVGFLAQHVFGYKPFAEELVGIDSSSRAANALALSQSMSWCIGVPWMICFLCYSATHFTVRHDLVKHETTEESRSLIASL